MDDDVSIIADFVNANRKALARYVRQKLIAADAKAYLDSLGKDGIEALDREAAGLLLDIACALLRRLHPEREFQPERILPQIPEFIRQHIQLPRSNAYHAIVAQLPKEKAQPD
jgi:hypothetical protein